MRVAALDLGSNTFLLLIADVVDGRVARLWLDETRVTRLGQGVHQNKMFHPDALARAELALAEFAGLIEKHGCERVVAVATSAARDVGNGRVLIEMGEKYGIPIRIISGQQEARITFRGAMVDWPKLNAAVIDVGGGSTEIIAARNGVPFGVSLNIGSVRLTELFLPRHPCAAADVAKLESHIRERIDESRERLPQSAPTVVAVAGTPSTLTTLDQKQEFCADRVHGYRLSVEGVWRWRDRLAMLSVAERQGLPGMQRERADVLVAGATILAMCAEAVGAKELLVSIKGLRFGVAQEWQDLLGSQ